MKASTRKSNPLHDLIMGLGVYLEDLKVWISTGRACRKYTKPTATWDRVEISDDGSELSGERPRS